ncbi:TRAP transporter small permease [Salipiger sp. IMCC34102]|uniref:TRAP transporter small permease n=1 Tax=Salipiger sp. IMCC34102 TaxID=2510647 RepID=UPI00101C9F95|nr:TRAP transporter small permease [Salipiger sp. IMCC34102]RYH00940.1 TRAP transporter small permease [Salipiger sp. IMCC34102]
MAGVLTRSSLTTVGRLLKRAADWIGVALFLTAFCGFMVQIYYRYVLNNPLRWTEEFTMIAFIWTVFWAAAFLVPIREHVSFEVVYDVVSPKVRRVFNIFSMVLIIVAFVVLIPATWDYLDFLTRKKSPVLRLPMHLIYGCYILFLVGFTIQAVARLAALFGPRWTDQI